MIKFNKEKDRVLFSFLLIRRFLFDNEQSFSLFSSSNFNFRFCDFDDSLLERIVEERLDRFGVKY